MDGKLRVVLSDVEGVEMGLIDCGEWRDGGEMGLEWDFDA